MAMGKYAIIFLFILSFTFWVMLGWGTPATDVVGCFQDPSNPLVSRNMNVTMPDGSVVTHENKCSFQILGQEITLYTLLAGLFGGLVTAAVIAAFFQKFPDPYALFAPVAVFMLAFMTFPVGLFSAGGNFVPMELKIFVGGIYMIAYMISLIEFMKGGAL